MGVVTLLATAAVITTNIVKYNSSDDSTDTSTGASAATSSAATGTSAASKTSLDKAIALTKDASVRGLTGTVGRTFVRGCPGISTATRFAKSDTKVRSLATNDISVKSTSHTLSSSRGDRNVMRGVITVSNVTIVASATGAVASVGSRSLTGMCAKRVAG